ncbi:MAG: diacylglycerol/polyprenol kinase family protein [Spirochaetaceae bacterium]
MDYSGLTRARDYTGLQTGSTIYRRLFGSVPADIRTELVRKSIHMIIAFVPLLARTVGTVPTMSLLALGTVFYATAEIERHSGRPVFVIGRLTTMAQRSRDIGHFVMGPVTLGLGAMAALLLYPYPAAAIAIYALAFGDGLASLVGKTVGRHPLPFTGGAKSIEGSLACFATVFAASSVFLGSSVHSFIVALAATALEAAPGKDIDNLLLPIGTGIVVVLIL